MFPWFRFDHIEYEKQLLTGVLKIVFSQIFRKVSHSEIANCRPVFLLKNRLYHDCISKDFGKLLNVTIFQNNSERPLVEFYPQSYLILRFDDLME